MHYIIIIIVNDSIIFPKSCYNYSEAHKSQDLPTDCCSHSTCQQTAMKNYPVSLRVTCCEDESSFRPIQIRIQLL